MTGRALQVYGTIVAAAGILALVVEIMARTGGALFYTLDDPYIHLAVAETILDGGYGVNLGEYASPSSSILYPFLLAALLALGLGTWAPGLLASAAALWSAWLIAGLYGANGVRAESAMSRAGAFILLPVLFFALNIYALPLTGMEHSLHVLTVCFVVAGLSHLDREAPVPPLLVAGIVLGPLIRFEGFAVSLAALLVLAWLGKRRALAICVLVLAATVGAYVALMSALGLPPVPSSVMVKSSASASAVDSGLIEAAKSMLSGLRSALRIEQGTLLALAMVAIWVSLLADAERGARRGALIFVALVGIGGHLALGRFGWWSRYEVYANTLALLSLAILYREHLRKAVRLESVRVLGLFGFLAIIAETYQSTTRRTADAAENIYAQQYQMHRFATEHFPEAVAVNDLGWVAYDNDAHVLDLWGLGSEEARLRRQRPDFGADDLRALVAARDVPYAMIYEAWFPDMVPSEWCRIAVLHTPRVSAAQGEVAFFLIDLDREAEFRAALNGFADVLPDVSRLTVSDCARPGSATGG